MERKRKKERGRIKTRTVIEIEDKRRICNKEGGDAAI